MSGCKKVLASGGRVGAFARGSNFALRDMGSRAATVILKKEDQRVFVLPVLLECLDEPPDALVHAVEHSGVNFHATSFPGFVIDIAPIAGLRRNLPTLIEQSELLHFLDALCPDSIVARIVLPFVLRDVCFLRMHRPMSRRMGEVKEERFVALLPLVIGDRPSSMIVQCVGVVELLRLIL